MSDNVFVRYPAPTVLNTTIPSGQNLSGPVEVDGQLFNGVRIPLSSGWTSASLTFMISFDGGKTYSNIYVDGAEYTITVPTGRTEATFFPVNMNYFSSVTHLRIRSGTTATPVNQGADRALQIGRMT